MLHLPLLTSSPWQRHVSTFVGGCGWSRCVYNCTDVPGGSQIYPCGPAHPLCAKSPTKPTYKYHLADPTCDINDPNGPFYDPVHKLYHNFYQIHVAEDQGGAGDGPNWGHWISSDFVHWAQLPVAIWNDRYFDNSAIFSGSTTIVNGRPVIMYPGRCKTGGEGTPVCNDGNGGFTFALAVPTNGSDPTYTQWSKEGSIGGQPFTNPVLNFTGDDPSTAWRTKDGEWRLIGNTRCSQEGGTGGNAIFGSADFAAWYLVGCITTMMSGECPSIFPLPSLTPGSEHYVASHSRQAPMPTHVHKASLKNGLGYFEDKSQVGVWIDGAPGPAGQGGTAGTWEVTAGSVAQFVDRGKAYAGKDFYDPTGKGRRILWLWGQLESGIQTLPREVTYHPGLQRLVYSPVAEMLQLRTAKLDSASAVPVLAPLTLRASAHCELELTFARPPSATNIEVRLPHGAAVTVNYTLPTTPEESVEGAGTLPEAWMVQVSLGGFNDSLPLLADDTSLTMRVFLDGFVAEAYFMGGRVALTSDLVDLGGVTNVQVASTAKVTLNKAVVYAMGDIHVDVEEVLTRGGP